MPQKKLTDEMREEIITHYKEFPDSYFAKKFNVSRFTISSFRFLRNLNKSKDKKHGKIKMTEENIQYVRDNINNKTVGELAEDLNVAYKTVSDTIQKYGISDLRSFNQITKKQKESIREKYYSGKMTPRQIAKEYETDENIIYRIIRNKIGKIEGNFEDCRKDDLFNINKFLKKLEKIMKIKQISKQKMSMDCGFDPSYVSLLFKNKRRPTLDFVLKMSKIYKISLDQLFEIKFAEKKEEKK